MPLIKSILIVTFCSVAFTFCDAMAANWAKSGSLKSLLIVLVFGPIGYLLFGLINLKMDLAVAGGLVNALVVIFTAVAGIIFFQQPLAINQIIGLSLIVLGVITVLCF